MTVRLVDSVEGPPRTTQSLVASLAARLGTMFVVSGADAIGSLASGVAAVGRNVAATAEGQRARRGLETSLAGHNGDALWRSLRIGEWISQMPASPVLDQLRNDYSLLLAEDLQAVLQETPAASQATSDEAAVPLEPATFLDFILGLWFISGEVRALIDALLESAVAEGPLVTNGPEQTSGALLR